MLKFNVKNQIIERLDEFRVVADSKNYLTADFMLSDEWEDKKVFASFSRMDAALAKEVEVKDGQCFVPWEVIKPPFFKVSLFCGDLITSNEINIQVESSGLKDGEPAGVPTPTVWNEYLKQIEVITQEILSQQVGKKIPDGGTIFGDLINNMAAAPFTTAMGSGCIAGMRGYFYSSIEFGEALSDGNYGPCKITLTKKQPIVFEEALAPEAFNIGFKVGDIISMVNNIKFPDCATITAVEKNVITVNSLPFNSVVDMIDKTGNVASDDYSVFVAAAPLSGDVPLGYGAFSGGEDALALERASFSWSRLGKSLGQYSFTANRETEAGYCAAAFGNKSKAPGYNSFAINTKTEARETGSFSQGNGTRANAPEQAVFGRYNIVDLLKEFALIVGGGDVKTGLRDNLFTIGWDGDLWSKGDIYFGGSNKKTAEKVIGQSEVYDIVTTAFATYTAKDLVAGITSEIKLKLLYEEDITDYSVMVDETEISERTPIMEKMRIASELLKSQKMKFVFYAGEEKVYTAVAKNTLPNRGMLFITE